MRGHAAFSTTKHVCLSYTLAGKPYLPGLRGSHDGRRAAPGGREDAARAGHHAQAARGPPERRALDEGQYVLPLPLLARLDRALDRRAVQTARQAN